MTINRALLIEALVCFILAALFVLVGFDGNGHTALTPAFLVPAGLASWVASALA